MNPLPILTAGHDTHVAFFSIQGLLAVATLAALETVLGIDNVIVIALYAGRLPPQKRLSAQRLGIACAVVTRIGLLLCVNWLTNLTQPINAGWPDAIPDTLHLGLLSWRDVILLAGGAFLIGKTTWEIHHQMQGGEQADGGRPQPGAASMMAKVILQIMIMDIIFSLDSVITAVGMSNDLPIMITAVVLSALAMVVFAKAVSGFIEKNPTVKILALAFLILVGVAIIAEGLPYGLDGNGDPMHHTLSKGVIYTAMLFSLGVECLNIRARKKSGKNLHLKDSHLPEAPARP